MAPDVSLTNEGAVQVDEVAGTSLAVVHEQMALASLSLQTLKPPILL